MKRKKVVKKFKVYALLSLIFALILLFSFILFSGTLLKLNVLPTKYLILYFIIVFVVFSVLFLFSFKVKNRVIKIISYILSSIMSIIFIVGSIYLKNTSDFLSSLNKKDEMITYSVVVLNDSKYGKIESLKEKTIAYLDDEYKDDIKSKLSSKVSYEELITTSSGDLTDKLLDKEVDAICVENTYLSVIEEDVEGFKDKTSSIYNFDIKIKEDATEKDDYVYNDNPFILYISGIDQYGQLKTVRGRSDVNQLAVVNPKTHKILLVNTPRDFYVQLAGTTGVKDKLTHAGMYGVDKSIKTLENLYDIDIDYYLKVNFDTLIKVVDAIGGIDIVSDKAFTAWTNRNVYIKKGENHLNGEQALAYARERRSYIDGDRHRGQNQQQVISAIINKVTKSSVLISKYNSILDKLDGSFQTSMSTKMITSFIKKQIDDMPSWSIETYSVTGSDASDYTYTFGSKSKLYVMIPNQETVNTAKEKMNNLLKEK